MRHYRGRANAAETSGAEGHLAMVLAMHAPLLVDLEREVAALSCVSSSGSAARS